MPPYPYMSRDKPTARWLSSRSATRKSTAPISSTTIRLSKAKCLPKEEQRRCSSIGSEVEGVLDLVIGVPVSAAAITVAAMTAAGGSDRPRGWESRG